MHIRDKNFGWIGGTAYIDIMERIEEIIRVAEHIKRGEVFNKVCDICTLERFNATVDRLKDQGLISETEPNLLHWEQYIK